MSQYIIVLNCIVCLNFYSQPIASGGDFALIKMIYHTSTQNINDFITLQSLLLNSNAYFNLHAFDMRSSML